MHDVKQSTEFQLCLIYKQTMNSETTFLAGVTCVVLNAQIGKGNVVCDVIVQKLRGRCSGPYLYFLLHPYDASGFHKRDSNVFSSPCLMAKLQLFHFDIGKHRPKYLLCTNNITTGKRQRFNLISFGILKGTNCVNNYLSWFTFLVQFFWSTIVGHF